MFFNNAGKEAVIPRARRLFERAMDVKGDFNLYYY